MLNVLRASLRTGRVTTRYPQQPEAAPPAFRGLPVLGPAHAAELAAGAAVCPAGAISDGDGAGWTLDLARCVFCGLCETAAPAAIHLGDAFELAARSRADLVIGSDGAPAASDIAADEQALRARLGERIRGLLRRSLHIRHLDSGSDNSTDWEIGALMGPVYDVQRLGIDFVASPRHADLLLVTGAVTRHLEQALRRTYEAMPEPRLVVAAGAEACGGGVLGGSYAVAGGVDRCLPVDVYIPGDPPRPQALIFGLLVAMDRLEPKLRRGRFAAAAAAE